MMKELTGVGVALVTPFHHDKTLDLSGLEKLVNHTLQIGVDFLVVMGTTGESPTCSLSEKQQILAAVKKVNAQRKPIVLGIGGNSTADVINAFSQFDMEGVSAILSASPYYNKPTQEGIYQHYVALADASPRPIIVYNVPGRTASNVTAETTLRLAKHPNIIGIKEASGNMEQAMRIARSKPSDFLLLSGEDLLTTSMISFGAEGVISVLANAFAPFCTMVHDAQKGHFEAASKHLFSLIDVNELMYVEGNPVGIKAALYTMGVCGGDVRLPLVKASEGLQTKINQAVAQLR